MATIIRIDGTKVDLPKPSFEDLQQAVGGFIEFVKLGKGKCGRTLYMGMNEDGRMMSLPMNRAASEILQQALKRTTVPVVGDVVICTQVERTGHGGD